MGEEGDGGGIVELKCPSAHAFHEVMVMVVLVVVLVVVVVVVVLEMLDSREVTRVRRAPCRG